MRRSPYLICRRRAPIVFRAENTEHITFVYDVLIELSRADSNIINFLLLLLLPCRGISTSRGQHTDLWIASSGNPKNKDLPSCDLISPSEVLPLLLYDRRRSWPCGHYGMDGHSRQGLKLSYFLPVLR